MRDRSSSIRDASVRLRMMSEYSAGAFANTCQAVFNQHFILYINKIKKHEDLKNANSPLIEDLYIHGCYTSKTARC